MTSQEHANHLLRIYQQRRHLKPAYRLIELPVTDPQEESDVIRQVLAS